MKKEYNKPSAVVVQMSFDEHIAASGDPIGGECGYRWFNNASTLDGGCTTEFYGDLAV